MTTSLRRIAGSELHGFWSRCDKLGDARVQAEAALSTISVLPILLFALEDEGSDLLEAMAAHSYHHRNGFVKITLPSGSSIEKNMRIHIWDSDEDSLTDSDAHDHRWAFSSRVLAGSLGHITYRAHPDRSGEVYHYRHGPGVNEATYRLDPVDRCSLEERTGDQIPSGAVYSLDANVVHRVGVRPGEYTATVVLEQPEHRETTNVYCESPDRVADFHLTAHRCSLLQTRQCLQKLAEQLISAGH